MSEPEVKNPKKIENAAKFLRETGLLFKINREVLHPLGMAMQVEIEANGDEYLSNKLWDCREDPEGIIFGPDNFMSGASKLDQFYVDYGNEKLRQRFNTLGFVMQDINNTASEEDVILTATFGGALLWLKAGKKVARQGWNGKGMFIALMPALSLPPYSTQEPGPKVNDRTAKFIGEDTPLESQPYIAMFTAEKKWQPGWTASQADLLANDWIVVE